MNEFEHDQTQISRVVRSHKALRNGSLGAFIICIIAIFVGYMNMAFALVCVVGFLVLAGSAHINLRKTQSIYEQD
jgi:hypothetical protein